jgi:hypothetical protein
MRMHDSVWQGNFGYWQNFFILQNILVIGHTAWSGYVHTGRGMVVCDVKDDIAPTLDWSIDIVQFEQTFVAQSQAMPYLQPLRLETTVVTPLLQAIATYDPHQGIVLVIINNGAIDINLLQHLAISPAQCYEQVQQRQSEFQPVLTSQGRHYD